MLEGLRLNMMREILEVDVKERELAIFWLGQNSFVFKTHEGTLISIDPYLSRSSKRGRIEDIYVHTEPPVNPEEFLVDYVFCTHDHLDHTDPDTISKIAKHSRKTMFLGPPESYRRFLEVGVDPERAICLKSGVWVDLNGFRVLPVDSIIGSEVDRYGRRWITHYGYIFDFGFVRVYNMGDSSPEVVKNPMKVFRNVIPHSPDIAIFPIIGDFPDRKPEDAFKFALILRPKIVIPCHYECFKNRTIDPKIFAEMFKDIPDIKPVIIEYMGKYIYRG